MVLGVFFSLSCATDEQRKFRQLCNVGRQIPRQQEVEGVRQVSVGIPERLQENQDQKCGMGSEICLKFRRKSCSPEDKSKSHGKENHRERKANHSPSNSPLPGHHNRRTIKQDPDVIERQQQKERHRQNRKRRENHRRRDGSNPFVNSGDQQQHANGRDKVQEKEKPNFKLSGKLAEDTNTYRGVVIKYSQPSEARKPRQHWRLYPFKGSKELPVLHIHRQSAYLLGRDRIVADIPTDHPSCSKQHAVLQYRQIEFTKKDGTKGRRVRPYIIDLDSSNGTYVNNNQIEPQRYVELLERDVLKFGFSTREYVLLHDASDTSAVVDEVIE